MTDVSPEAKDQTPTRRTNSAMSGSAKRRNRWRTVLALVLVLLVLLLITLVAFIARLSTPVGAPKSSDVTSGMQWVRSIYGWGKAESQQLYGPTDVAFGPDGTVWVNDPQRFQLVGFNPDGSYKTIIHKGPGYMMPQAFDVSDENEIYIADFKSLKIRVFSPDNKELRSWDASMPMEVAVDGDRVVVGQRDGVAVYDKKGALILKWGTRGNAKDQYDVVRGTAIGPDGSYYVSDTQNHRLKAFSKSGKLKWVYPTEPQFKEWETAAAKGAKSKKPFQIPAGMAFDAAGRLVLVDPFEFKIMIIDPATGKVVGSYGEYGETDGKFGYPTSIDYDAGRDWYAVADTANNRVQLFRIDGSGGGPLSALARASVGPVWVCGIPLFLLLLAVALMVMRRRQSRNEDTDSSIHTAKDSSSSDIDESSD